MAFRIQLRRDTTANWTSINPILLQGEFGYEINTGNGKIGDGVTVWNSLPYYGGTGPTGPGVPAGGATGQFLTKISGSDYDTAWTSSLVSTDAPGTTGATGTTGALALSSTHLYVCVATNSWRRTALTAF